MKSKTLLLLLMTIVVFTGCGKKESDTIPVVSEAIEETDTTEPEELMEEVNDVEPEAVEPETNTSSDVEVDGEIVEGTALTKEELEELKANAPDDEARMNIEIYEEIVNNGSWDPGEGVNPFTKVIGTPSEDGWSRFGSLSDPTAVYFDKEAWYEDNKKLVESYEEPKAYEGDTSEW